MQLRMSGKIEEMMDTRMNLTMAPLANPRFPRSLDKVIDSEIKDGRQKVDPNNAMDRKKIRRLVSNRLSAQRSREKKTQHIQHLECLLEDLQVFISIATPKVREHKDKVNLLMIENHFMLKQVQKLSHQSRLQEMELEQLKEQVTKLKDLENSLKQHMYEQSLGGLQDRYPNLSFYKEGMKNFNNHGKHQLVKSTLNSGRLKVASVSCTRSSNKDELSSSRIKQSREISELDKMQEENDIDQYLDIDAVTVDFSDVST